MIGQCKENKIRNPKTGKCITINGVLHKKLIKEGVINGPSPSCPEGKAYNRHTKRCIKLGTKIYNNAVRNGWIVQGDPEPQAQPTPKCKNDVTFVYFDEIKDISTDDLLRTPDGYCFSARELIMFIQSDGFDNKNPHDQSRQLFEENKINEEYILKHKGLHKLVQRYFEILKINKLKSSKIFKDTLGVLYKVCDTGRICYFNNIFNHSTDNSSTFTKSINALSELSQELEKLSEEQKQPYEFVFKKIESANMGTTCIHGVGTSLIQFFIQEFHSLKIPYDSTKTKLYFVKKSKSIMFISYEHRHTLNTKNFPNSRIYKTMESNVKNNMLSKDRKEKSKMFEDVCIYDAFMVTNDSLEEWGELPDWRKIMFSDNSCYDLFYLIKIITNNLNNTKNNNPYPIFPYNPFTRQDFTTEDLLFIKQLLEDNFIITSETFNVFFKSDLLHNSTRWRNKVLTHFETNLRFMRLNNIVDGNLQCIGVWMAKSTPIIEEEKYILKYLRTADPRTLQELKKWDNAIIPEKYYFELKDRKSKNRVYI